MAFTFNTFVLLGVVIAATSIDFTQGINTQACKKISIGLTDSGLFPNNLFSATSSAGESKPYDVRYNSEGWSPRLPRKNSDYLEIKFESPKTICAIGIKGGQIVADKVNHMGNVKTLKFSYLVGSWRSLNIFGTKYPSREILNVFSIPLIAKSVRFYPRKGTQYPVMRVQLYGMASGSTTVYGKKPSGSCNKPLGMENYGIDNSQIAASTETTNRKDKYGKQSARLNSKYVWRNKEAGNNKEFIQVDLEQIKSVTGIAMQGDPNTAVRVTKFKVQYSKDGKSWVDYKTFKVDVKSETTLNWFNRTLNTRYVRVNPRAWNRGIPMRIELYGCEPTCDNQPVGLGNGQIKNSRMTASSTLSDDTKASNGRLEFTSTDSWCAAMDGKNAYLQIDLGVTHVLCAVATQGNSKVDQMVTSYTLQTSRDRKAWIDYKENGKIRTFQGNSDSNSVVKNYLSTSLVGRCMRILPKTFVGAPCLRVEFYGVKHTTCTKSSSGIGEPHYTIPDHRFTATTVFHYKNYAPWRARTQDKYGWEPKGNKNKMDFLQIDLGDPHVLCAVGLQPSGQSYRNGERTESFKIAFSMDGHDWTFYQKGKELVGNKHPDNYYSTPTIIKNTFDKVQVAKFVRMYPVKYHKYKVIRTELYGLKQAWKKPLGLESVDGKSNILDKQIVASSSLDKTHIATNGRLYGGNSWCGKRKGRSHLQVDLGSAKQLTGIAIQGDGKTANWVTQFDLEYGYLPNDMKTVKNIQTNLLNQKQVKVHWLPGPVGARFVRVVPTKWKNGACMRIELFGNDRAPPAKIISSDIVGTLTTKPDSFVTVKCVASGDDAVKMKWLLNGQDVTDKAQGNAYAKGQTTSELHVNFISVLEVKSTYKCKKVDGNRMRCVTDVTCQAERKNANGDRKSNEVEVFIDLSPPTQAPTEPQPEVIERKIHKVKPPSGPKSTAAPIKKKAPLKKKVHKSRRQKPKFKKPKNEKLESAAITTSGAWTLVSSVGLGMIGMLLL